MTLTSYILAGGKGERLRPLTHKRAKPAVQIADRKIIDVAISHAINANSKEIFLITQYLSHTIEDYVIQHYPKENFQKYNLKILSPEQECDGDIKRYNGTADSIRKNIDTLENTASDYILILSGDQLFNMDIFEMVNFMQEKDVDLAIACHPILEEDASRMGVMKVNEEGIITAFEEKPEDPSLIDAMRSLKGDKTHLASMGLYLFKKEALCNLLKNYEGDDFGKDLIPLQLKLGPVGGFIYRGYWEDIGTIRSYYEACLALADNSSHLRFDDENHPINAPHYLTLPPRIEEASVNRSMICQGSVILKGAQITHSLIGPKVHIGKGSLMEKSIVISYPNSQNSFSTKIDDEVEIKNAIIDSGCTIGKGVKLLNKEQHKTYEDDYLCVVDNIIVVRQNINIPDGYCF